MCCRPAGSWAIGISLSIVVFAAAGSHGQVLIDHTCTNLGAVPDDRISAAAATLHIAYNHTSHGSQIISGMEALERFPPFGGAFRWSGNGSAGLDLEAYDPDGGYFWDLDLWDNLDYDGGNWARQWIAANPGSELAQLTTGNGVSGYSGCRDCAHSDSPAEATLNCVLKGRAAWWMFARLAGWQRGSPAARRATGRVVPGG